MQCLDNLYTTRHTIVEINILTFTCNSCKYLLCEIFDKIVDWVEPCCFQLTSGRRCI